MRNHSIGLLRRMLRSTTSLVSSDDCKKFAVLVTGHAADGCRQRFGDYGDLFVKLLRERDQEVWDMFNVVDQQFPSRESIDFYDGFVITGSKHDAHGQEEWIVKLRDFVREIHRRRRKILGICFGHQLTAIALGGASGKAACGWELGVVDLEPTAVFREKFPNTAEEMRNRDKIRIHQVHQDQVSVLPPEAVLLASSKNTPIEMYSVSDNVLCMQGHPEFNSEIVKEILNDRSGSSFTEERASEALKSLEISVDRDLLLSMMKRFLKGSNLN